MKKVLNDIGGGFKEPIKALQIGGPLGGVIPISEVEKLNLDFQDAFFGTGQDAVNPTSNYEIVFKLIDKVTELNNVKYIDCSENLNVTISQEDEYQDISAVIEEAADGDYFKIYGLKDGSIDNFAKYINLRQQTGADDIVVFHDIEVLEQTGITFTQTSAVSYAQVDNFDKPIVYRPVIQSANISNAFLIKIFFVSKYFATKLWSKDSKYLIDSNAYR